MANEPVKTPVFSLLTLRDTRSCLARAALVRGDLVAVFVGREGVDERVLGREHEVGRAKNRVRTRGEDAHVGRLHGELPRQPAGDGRRPGQLFEILNTEADLGAVGPPDPVALGLFGGFGPVETVEVVQQPARVVGDAEEPLLERPLLHFGAAPLALAVDDLLIGEDGLVVRAPIDGRALLIGQSALKQLQEKPLCPLVIVRIGCRQLVPPVNH